MILTLLTALVAPTYACAPTEIESAVQEGLIAFATMDEDGVSDAVAAVDAKLACQSAPVTPATAAQVHRMHGLKSFLEADTDAAKRAFAAALALDPTTQLPTKIAPDGGKLARLYAESALPAGATTALGLGADYRGYVDGTESSKRPTDRPAVVQLSSYDVVKYSGWLTSASPIPAQFQPSAAVAAAQPKAAAEPAKEPKAAPEPKEPKPVKEPKPAKEPVAKAKPTKEHHNTGAWVATAASAVVAGGLFGTAVYTNSTFDTSPSHTSYTLNHVGYWGSIGAGALTVGLLTVSIVGSF